MGRLRPWPLSTEQEGRCMCGENRRPGVLTVKTTTDKAFLGVGSLLLILGLATLLQPARTMGQAPPPEAPTRLAETGLYSDFPSRTIDPRNLAYSPQYPLWS